MARVNTYLNFQGQTREAFGFYADTFGTHITALTSYADMPADGPGGLSADDLGLVMNAQLPIVAGHVLMGTDMLDSLGQHTQIGNTAHPARGADRPTFTCWPSLYVAGGEGGGPEPSTQR